MINGSLRSRSDAPMVSVVIPCWNAEAFIADAVRSALDQTYPSVEVIVVDDGSTDRTLERVQAFGEKVRLVTGPNAGACAARNRGIRMSRGSFVQFLDADDILLPERIERMVRASESCGELEIAASDWYTESGAKGVPYINTVAGCDADPVLFCLNSQMQTSSPLHRRSRLIDIGGFKTSLPCSQERDLHLRLACNGIQWRRLPEPLFIIRKREASISSDIRKVLDQHAEIFLEAREILSATGRLTAMREEAIAAALSYDGRLYTRLGEFQQARRYFEMAARVSANGAVSGFNREYSRLLCRLIGPLTTERLIQFVSRLARAVNSSRIGKVDRLRNPREP